MPASAAASPVLSAASAAPSAAAASLSAPCTADTPAPGQRLPGGLVYVNSCMPGLQRVRKGKGFGYRQPDGHWLSDAQELERIRRLAIPPAYTDVWVCPLANGHLQATGLDARGRRQYRYHAQWRQLRDAHSWPGSRALRRCQWRQLRDAHKFERMAAFGKALPRIRAQVARDLAPRRGQTTLARTEVLAAIVRLLDTTYLRVGNEEYAVSNQSYGLTTLRTRHAGVRGSTLQLRFRGKSGVQQSVQLSDPRVARVVRRCQQLPGQELFQYQDENGERHSVGSGDVNDYLRDITAPAARRNRQAGAGEGSGNSSSNGSGSHGAATAPQPHFTAKDFRTWHGTVQALELTRLACRQTGVEGTGTQGTPAAAQAWTAQKILVEVARQLGNTPAVCKKAYVHPAVLELGSRLASDAGPGLQCVWERIGGAASPRGLSAAERRLLAFLRRPEARPRPAPAAAKPPRRVPPRGAATRPS